MRICSSSSVGRVSVLCTDGHEFKPRLEHLILFSINKMTKPISFKEMMEKEKEAYDELLKRVEEVPPNLKLIYNEATLFLTNAEILTNDEKSEWKQEFIRACEVLSLLPLVIIDKTQSIREMTIQLIENTGDDLQKEQKAYDDFIVFLSDMQSRLEISLNSYRSDSTKLLQCARYFKEELEEIPSKMRLNRVLTMELIKIGYANRKSDIEVIGIVLLIIIVVAILLVVLAVYHVFIK